MAISGVWVCCFSLMDKIFYLVPHPVPFSSYVAISCFLIIIVSLALLACSFSFSGILFVHLYFRVVRGVPCFFYLVFVSLDHRGWMVSWTLFVTRCTSEGNFLWKSIDITARSTKYWGNIPYLESEDSWNPLLFLHQCTFTMPRPKGSQHKSMMKSVFEGRWHLLVYSKYCKLSYWNVTRNCNK